MTAEETVKQAEKAYDSLNLGAIMLLFDPQIVVYWNGQRITEGLEETRQ